MLRWEIGLFTRRSVVSRRFYAECDVALRANAITADSIVDGYLVFFTDD